LDEYEREIVPEEALPEDATQEEVPAEQPPEEGTQDGGKDGVIDDDIDDDDEEEDEEEDDEDKPEKPIKGPGAWSWCVAAAAVLFALVMAIPSLWYTGLGLTAAGGLLNEAGHNYQSALAAYEFLYNTDMRTGGWEIGLTSGNFPFERQYAIQGRLNGPLQMVQNESMPPVAEVFRRLPKGLRKLSAQYDAIAEILESLNTHLTMIAEEQSQAEWLLAGLEAARGADKLAKERRLIYDSLALQFTAGDPAMKRANKARLAALKKDRAAELWMYEGVEYSFAFDDEDYAAVIALSDARLKRNREDVQSMCFKVKAMFLNGDAEKAFATADAYAKRPFAADLMQLVKAELLCRQDRFDEALRLCGGVLERIDITAPESEQSLYYALEAVRTKAAVLLVKGSAPEEARDMLYEAWGIADSFGVSPNLDYFHTLLAAYIMAGDEEAAEGLSQQMGAVPQSITDLREGTRTFGEIISKGWGGFNA